MPSSRCHAVLYQQSQGFGVDVKEIAVDVYVLRCSFRFPYEPCVAFQGGFIVSNRDVASLVERRDVNTLLAVKRFDQAFGSERRGSAIRVVYHYDVLDSE